MSEFELDFNTWVDRILTKHASNSVVAYNFNLYEHATGFAIQLVGTRLFDLRDQDWAGDRGVGVGFVDGDIELAHLWRA